MATTFTRMDESTAEQWGVIGTESFKNQSRVADRVLGMLESLSDIVDGFATDQLTHCLQTATLAERAGADEEVVVAALCHDIGKAVSVPNHPRIAAEILRPYVRDEVYKMILVHQDFQGRHYYAHFGGDPDAREKHRDELTSDEWTLAEKFADEMKVERVPNSYFDTPKRREQWQEAIKKEQKDKDTVGAVALDVHGNLAAATSTGGLTNKRFGRLGDVPVIGAGTYANNKTCAISATGYGEEFIKHTVAHDISSLMEYGGLTLQQAADRVIHQKLKPGDGGVIGVARDGSIALVFNSEGMYRGAADSSGRFEVKIWE